MATVVQIFRVLFGHSVNLHTLLLANHQQLITLSEDLLQENLNRLNYPNNHNASSVAEPALHEHFFVVMKHDVNSQGPHV